MWILDQICNEFDGDGRVVGATALRGAAGLWKGRGERCGEVAIDHFSKGFGESLGTAVQI